MRYLAMVVVIIGLAAALPAKAEIPTVLTDKVRQGDGLINIMTDVSGEELTSYLEGGTLYLGVDVNEDASGLESSLSSGVAINGASVIAKDILTSNGVIHVIDAVLLPPVASGN